MRILCAGISHKTANVALRERLAMDQAQRAAALTELLDRWPEAEFAVLSTCNRTEVYAARSIHGHPRTEELHTWLAARAHGAPGAHEAVAVLVDDEAVDHLFAVASGLDSLVPGEEQIVAQLKQAYAEAVEAGTARVALNELMQAGLHVAKRIRTETQIGSGKASVASAALDCVTEALGNLSGATVLSIGAGKMNELMLRRLAACGVVRLLVVNRSPAPAEALAARCGGRAVPFGEIARHLADADVVLTSTGSPQPILTAEMVTAAMHSREDRPLLALDIAVPRDVDPAAGEVPGVRLLNIDDLETVVRDTLRLREDERDAARRIVAEHVKGFLQTMNIRQVAPTLGALYRHMRRIADGELDDARNKLSTHDDAEEDVRILRRALHRTIRRILHPAATHLRGAAGSDAARAHAAALRKLFALEEEPGQPRKPTADEPG